MVRQVGFVGFAALVSVVAVLFVHAWLAGPPSSRAVVSSGRTASPAVVRVLVVNAELPAGSVLRRGQLQWEAWPAESASPYIVEGRARASDFEGAVLRSRLAVDQPLIADQVARVGERGFMAAILAPGDSAVTVNVAPNTGIAGFIFPGDRVDLLLTMMIPSSANAPPRHMSQTILTNLRVVGIDQTLSDEKKVEKKDLVVPKTVTLEVTPKQAEVVALASDSGVISLSLRSLASSGEATQPTGIPTWDSELTHVAPVRTASNGIAPRLPRIQLPRGVSVFRGGQGDPAAPVAPPPEASHS